MNIDVHSHAMDEQMLRLLMQQPAFGYASDLTYSPSDGYRWKRYGRVDPPLYDLEQRMRSLKEREIDVQLVGMWPPFLNAGAHGASVEFASEANACLARVVGDSAGRLLGMAVIPFGAPDRMVYELEKSVAELGFKGVMMGTSVAGRPIDSPEYWPIFEAIERLDLVIFMHSTAGFERAAYADYSMRVLVGFPGETTLAAARLIFSGVLERHPNLKLVLSHGGGTLPYLRGRLDLGYRATEYEHNPQCVNNISKLPSAYVDQLYYDTLVADDEVLRFLIRTVGPEHVLFGSDYPFEVGDPEGIYALRTVNTLAEEERALIRGGNAARLLGLN